MKKTLRDLTLSEVARIIREERQARGLSLNALSEKAGLSRVMVGYIEQEQRGPTLDSLLRIAEALGVDLADVLKRAERAAKERMQ